MRVLAEQPGGRKMLTGRCTFVDTGRIEGRSPGRGPRTKCVAPGGWYASAKGCGAQEPRFESSGHCLEHAQWFAEILQAMLAEIEKIGGGLRSHRGGGCRDEYLPAVPCRHQPGRTVHRRAEVVAVAFGGPFLANVIASGVVVVILAIWRSPLALLTGLGMTVGTLGAFARSRIGNGIFGFSESGLGPSPEAVIALVAETAAALACGFTLLAWRRSSERER